MGTGGGVQGFKDSESGFSGQQTKKTVKWRMLVRTACDGSRVWVEVVLGRGLACPNVWLSGMMRVG
jgi:hypothetical protein